MADRLRVAPYCRLEHRHFGAKIGNGPGRSNTALTFTYRESEEAMDYRQLLLHCGGRGAQASAAPPSGCMSASRRSARRSRRWRRSSAPSYCRGRGAPSSSPRPASCCWNMRGAPSASSIWHRRPCAAPRVARPVWSGSASLDSVLMLDMFAELFRSFRASYPRVKIELRHMSTAKQSFRLSPTPSSMSRSCGCRSTSGRRPTCRFTRRLARSADGVPADRSSARRRASASWTVADLAEQEFVGMAESGCGVGDQAAMLCRAGRLCPAHRAGGA